MSDLDEEHRQVSPANAPSASRGRSQSLAAAMFRGQDKQSNEEDAHVYAERKRISDQIFEANRAQQELERNVAICRQLKRAFKAFLLHVASNEMRASPFKLKSPNQPVTTHLTHIHR